MLHLLQRRISLTRFLLIVIKLIMVNNSKKKLVDGGRVVSFYIGERHLSALRQFRENQEHKSDGAALRHILEIVSQTQGDSNADS